MSLPVVYEQPTLALHSHATLSSAGHTAPAPATVWQATVGHIGWAGAVPGPAPAIHVGGALPAQPSAAPTLATILNSTPGVAVAHTSASKQPLVVQMPLSHGVQPPVAADASVPLPHGISPS